MVRKISLINAPEQNDLSNIVSLKSIRGSAYVDFVVDTGSPLTIIPFQKAKELNLPIKDLQGEENIRLLGTRHKVFRFPKPLTFTFLCEDGEMLSIDFSPLIAKPFKEDEKWVLTELIMGIDFLRENGFKLFCDMRGDVGYLEGVCL